MVFPVAGGFFQSFSRLVIFKLLPGSDLKMTFWLLVKRLPNQI